MSIEIERKFLIKNDAWKERAKKGKLYRQGYIPTAKGATVRVRVIKNKKAILTVKGAKHGISRSEWEYSIPVEEANQILEELCNGYIIEKTRHKLKDNDLEWEIDVFHKENEGLVTAEVELESEEQYITLPGWIGKEVSKSSKYSSAALARLPFNKWRKNANKSS